jgi:hypothetical protein
MICEARVGHVGFGDREPESVCRVLCSDNFGGRDVGLMRGPTMPISIFIFIF